MPLLSFLLAFIFSYGRNALSIIKKNRVVQKNRLGRGRNLCKKLNIPKDRLNYGDLLFIQGYLEACQIIYLPREAWI